MDSIFKLVLFGILMFFLTANTCIFSEEAKPETNLTGKRVAILIGEGFHDGETYIPMGYMVNHGAEVTVIGVNPGTHKAYNSEITAVVHKSIKDISPEDFDALIIPGGHSPNWLRKHDEAVKFAGEFFTAGRITAAICHGPQVLISAGVIKGRKSTCFPGMSEELKEAGALYQDVEVIRDGNLITSRVPNDIPAFCKTIAQALMEKTD